MRTWAAALALTWAAATPAGAAVDWTPFRDTAVIEIRTEDPDGAARETKVWVVVLDAAYVRTNDSRWLANIRRGSPVELHAAGVTLPVRAREVDDAVTQARVEEAFLAKYGLVQRILSAVRLREPTVLRLDPI